MTILGIFLGEGVITKLDYLGGGGGVISMHLGSFLKVKVQMEILFWAC